MKTRAFTLIELLIVVAIIAILAAIAVPNFIEAQIRAKVSRDKADMRAVAIAVESYCVDHGSYAPCNAWNNMWDADYSVFSPGGSDQYYVCYSWEYIQYGGDVGNPGSPLIEGCDQWITTPVAYIAAVPLDPFNTAGLQQIDNEVYGGVPILAASCFYGMRYSQAPVGVQFVEGTAGDGPIWHDIGYWLFSVGPQADWNAFGIPQMGSVNNNNVEMVFTCPPYDPSNGTVSIGDIVYIGKGIGYAGQQ